MMDDIDYWKEFWSKRAEEIADPVETVTGIRKSDLSKTYRQFQERRERCFFDIKPCEVVLDAGCGTGGSILRYGSLTKRMIGIDLSKGMVVRCSQSMKQLRVSNVRVLTANIMDLPFKNRVFDKIICRSVAQYLDEESFSKTLEELRRVTKMHGEVIMHVKNSVSLYGLTMKTARMIKALVSPKEYHDHYHSYRWYRRQLGYLGTIVEEFSEAYHPFLAPVFVRRVMGVLESLFITRLGFLKSFGVEFFFKLRVGEGG